MQLLMAAFVAILFFVLTPGIVLSLPPKGSKIVVAATHAIVFAVVYSLTHKLVYSYLYEGFLTVECGNAKAAFDRIRMDRNADKATKAAAEAASLAACNPNNPNNR
jgi:hypothetical protein